MNWVVVFYLTCFEILIDGFLIYFLHPNKTIHLVKDATLLLTFLFFMMKEPLKAWADSLGQALGKGIVFCMGGLILLCVFQIFNPLSPGLLRGVLGLKLMFMPWMGILLGYAYPKSTKDFQRFMRFLGVASVPINAFGILQYIKGPTFMIQTFGPGFGLNTMTAFIHGVADADSFVRIIGTFASSAHYSLFLGMNTMICFGLYFAEPKRRFLWLAVLLLNFFALLATGSRGGFTTVLIMIAIFLFFSRRSSAAISVFLISLFCLFLGFSVMRESVGQRFRSGTKFENIRERTLGTAPQQFMEYLDKYPMGRGIGAASQASRHLGKREGQFFLVENYLSKVQLEIGIVGVMLFYLFIFLILYRWVTIWLPSSYFMSHPIYFYAVALTSYGFGQFTVGTLFSSIDSPPASLFLWVVMGMMMRVPSIIEIETQELEPLPEE